MNGVISTSMRQKGMNYKLIFGVPIPEIKHIAAARTRCRVGSCLMERRCPGNENPGYFTFPCG